MPAPSAAQSSTWADRAASFTTAPATKRAGRAVGLAVPVVLVNAVAFFGQFGYLKEHLPWPPAGVAMAAIALESIAIYLQWHAHLAQMSNDSALRLRLASYGVALLVAAMNYSHYAGPHWKPTAAAVLCALMSAASPWLWAIHSRRVSRDELMARGKVEEHALRLGSTRWTWHPVRSTRVMSWAAWTGEADPRRAIAAFAGKYEQPVAARGGKPGSPPASLPAQPEPVAALPASEPAVHAGVARLAAVPSLPHQPSAETIAAVEDRLADLPVTGLPSAREVARWLGSESGQRMRAKNMLAARRHTETQKPVNHAGNGGRTDGKDGVQLTSWPKAFSPGGVSG